MPDEAEQPYGSVQNGLKRMRNAFQIMHICTLTDGEVRVVE